jgi:hypothetical protein
MSLHIFGVLGHNLNSLAGKTPDLKSSKLRFYQTDIPCLMYALILNNCGI